MDEDGFQIWQDEYDSEQDPDEPIANVAQRHEDRHSWLRRDAQENEENKPEIPESSQVKAPSSLKNDSAVEVEALKQSKCLSTPAKSRTMEIPSTQTPPSTVSSAREHLEYQAQQHSLLKERSGNVRLRNLSQDTPEGLEKVLRRTQRVPLNDIRSNVHAHGTSKTHRPDPSLGRTPKGLQRVDTVPDSQPDDEDLSITPKLTKYVRPPLKRTTTVQDSQFDEEDLLTQLSALDEAASPHQSTYRGYTQATYDPVYSALSRDAARFRWTQTQKAQEANSGACEGSETEDEDLDRGCCIIDDEDYDDNELRILEGQSTAAATSTRASNMDVNDDVAASKMCPRDRDRVSTQEIPSSPPCLRSSQDSVVVSKDALPGPPSKLDADVVYGSQPHTYLSEASTIVPYSSPSQIEGRFKAAPEGSAIPLPPWSSSCEVALNNRVGTGKSEIKDWSLPPPPPMSSSRAATQASSSRR